MEAARKGDKRKAMEESCHGGYESGSADFKPYYGGGYLFFSGYLLYAIRSECDVYSVIGEILSLGRS